MTAMLHEVLGGLGLWTLELDWDADLVAKLVRGSVLHLYDGQRLTYQGILLTRTPAEKAFTIEGQGLDWLLGVNDAGPLIESREYLACTDKMANGDFDLGDLYYRFGQDTHWDIAPTGPASVSADSPSDDLLESDETFPALPGQQYRLTVIGKRNSGTIGRLRGRIVYEGRYDRPNLLTNGDFALGAGHGWGTATDLAIVTDPHEGTKYAMRVGPSTQPNAIVNGDFEAGPLSGWTVVGNSLLAPVSQIINDPARARTGDYVLLVGTTQKRAVINGDFETGDLTGWAPPPADTSWGVSSDNREGNWAAEHTAVGASYLRAEAPPEASPAAPGAAAGHAIVVAAGEKWRIEGYAKSDGTSVPNGKAWLELQFYENTLTRFSVKQSDHLDSTNPGTQNWRHLLAEIAAPDGYPVMVSLLEDASTSGKWRFDSVTCVRVEGNEEVLTSDAIDVVAGEEWTPLLYAESGLAFISGGLFPRVRVTGSGKPDVIHELTALSQTGHQWFISGEPVTIEDGYDTAYLELRGRDIEGEWIYVDDCSFVRTKGNIDQLPHDAFAVTPGRTYRCTADLELDATLAAGEVSFLATYSGAGRTDVVVEGSPTKVGDTGRVLSIDLTPPSGYDSVALAVKGTDIVGGSFWVRNLKVIDQDGATVVEDLVISATGLATYTHDSAAPDGTQKVHVQLLVESKGAGWEVDEWHLQRIGTPVTVAEIVADLLEDDVGTQLVTLGTVYDGSATIVHDWQIANLHNRDALVHLLSGGVAAALREYRVDAKGKLSVGTAEELYEDRTDLVLTAFDIVVTEPPDATTDDTDYFSHVKVEGAQRETANGDPITITAIVAVPWASPLLDSGGIAVRRTKVVTDSSVNHPLYAQALATSIANDMAARQSAVLLRMSDLRARGDVSVGDWIYPYVPDAGLVDKTNPMPARDGSTAFPEKIRIVERTQRFGDGYRALATPPGGEEIDITDSVRWEDMTNADITVGTFVPSFTVDDQGGAALKQFLRFRTSAAR